jgi:MFS family permease
MTQNALDYQSGAGGPGTIHQGRLFLGCFISLIATAFGFVVRGMVITEWGTVFNLTETQKGSIIGAGLFPFAISIILFSLFIDRLGYGKTMIFAWLGHVVSAILTITAQNYTMLYFGTLLFALANGAVEAVINPVAATLYPKEKTKYLNFMHAGWPGGMVLAGILAIAMGSARWELKVGLVLIPAVIYGILLFGQRFPVHERVAAGVSYADMMREFGAAGCFIVVYFLVMALMTVFSVLVPEGTVLPPWTNYLPLIVSVIAGVVFLAAYQSLGRPMFVFLLVVMVLLATTELGVDSWVVDLMTPVLLSVSAKGGALLLVYTALIMTILRFCAGPIVHRLSPLGMLATCAAIAALGLVFLSLANTAALVFIAATMYGVGKTFFWPTTLGVVSEQFPRGGALTLNAMGGMGMIAVGVLGGPMLGTLLDRALDADMAKTNSVIHKEIVESEKTNFGITYRPLDKKKIAAFDEIAGLEKASKVSPTASAEEVKAGAEAAAKLAAKNLTAQQLSAAVSKSKTVGDVVQETKHGMLMKVAVLPAIMCICYIGLIMYFQSKGGYQVKHLTAEGPAQQ